MLATVVWLLLVTTLVEKSQCQASTLKIITTSVGATITGVRMTLFII